MNARAAAIKVLGRVSATDAYLNVVLDAQLDEERFEDSRDTALVTELCYGATRRQLALDFALARFSDRGLRHLEDRVLAALRIGCYQLFFLRIPARAAVAETVGGLRQLGLERATGFVNAILRKLAALPALPSPPLDDRAEFLSVTESHPRWLVARWLRTFGTARAEQMLQSDNQARPVVIRVNSRRASREQLVESFRESGIEAHATNWAPQAIALRSPGRLADLYGYREGLWQVQDEAAQLVITYAALTPASRILDVCAAPGGKACYLAEKSEVIAIDLHANKLHKIETEAKRLSLEDRIKIHHLDATKPIPPNLGKFDAVLLDAPCSGTGTLNRHPELRYRRQEADLVRLVALQKQLLENVSRQVPRGGILVFAVCSTEPEEGEAQIENFLATNPSFKLRPPTDGVTSSAHLREGCLRTLPGPENLDGFFAARLERAS